MIDLALLFSGAAAVSLALAAFDSERDGVSRLLDAGTLILVVLAIGCLIVGGAR